MRDESVITNHELEDDKVLDKIPDEFDSNKSYKKIYNSLLFHLISPFFDTIFYYFLILFYNC